MESKTARKSKTWGGAVYDFDSDTYTYTGSGVSHESIFQCASLSKQVFAIIVLKMADEKKINLNKTIYDYLTQSELNCCNINSKYDTRYEKITIRMLMTHTSGLGNGTPHNNLAFEPGSEYRYSGNAFSLLQKIVEKITDKTLDEIYRDSVYIYDRDCVKGCEDKIGMENSSFIYESKFNERLALPYEGDITQPSFRKDRIRPHSQSSLYSNLQDYVRIIKRNKELLKIMATPQFKINDNISVGLGCLLYDGYIWQWGDNYWYKNFLIYDPYNDMGFVSFSNNTRGWDNIIDMIPKDIIAFLVETHKDYDVYLL